MGNSENRRTHWRVCLLRHTWNWSCSMVFLFSITSAHYIDEQDYDQVRGWVLKEIVNTRIRLGHKKIRAMRMRVRDESIEVMPFFKSNFSFAKTL